MIRTLLKAAVTAAAMMSAAQAAAQVSAQVTDTTGTTTIIAPISLTKNSNLVFGTVTRPTGGNSSVVKITPGGVFSVTGGDAKALASGGAPTAAAYTVNGETGAGYNILVGTLAMSGPGNGSIPVTLTRSKASGSLTNGADTFAVGGEFTISNGTPLGAYTGTFTVEVAYN